MTPLERLLDLVAFLLASRHPVPAETIFESFPDEYKGSRDTRDRKLSRDKDALRNLGIPIAWVQGDDEHESGYVIERESFYLPRISLAPEEKAALYAVGAEAIRSAFPLRGELAHALTKLRAAQGGDDERARPPLFAASTGEAPFQELIARATTEHRRLRVVYPAERTPRLFDPYAFARRRGRLSVVGFCHLRGGLRTFHADRMEACELATPSGKGNEFQVPADFDASRHLARQPWQLHMHPPMRVELAFSPELAESGPRTLGLDEPRSCMTTNLDGLIGQVLSLGAGARITAPPEARARVREKLQELRRSLEPTS